jgi:hypothetical protein
MKNPRAGWTGCLGELLNHPHKGAIVLGVLGGCPPRKKPFWMHKSKRLDVGPSSK